MKIAVRGKHLKENQALEEYALKKASRLSRYARDITKIEVEMLSEPSHVAKDDDFIVDVTVHVSGRTMQVRDSEADMYKAIDKAVKRMEEALRRNKEKHIEKFRRTAAKAKRFLRGFWG